VVVFIGAAEGYRWDPRRVWHALGGAADPLLDPADWAREHTF
jgi:hypothetical protein